MPILPTKNEFIPKKIMVFINIELFPILIKICIYFLKKLNIWNELVEKVNTDFDENRKEFWAFVGRKTKGKKEKYRLTKE